MLKKKKSFETLALILLALLAFIFLIIKFKSNILGFEPSAAIPSKQLLNTLPKNFKSSNNWPEFFEECREASDYIKPPYGLGWRKPPKEPIACLYYPTLPKVLEEISFLVTTKECCEKLDGKALTLTTDDGNINPDLEQYLVNIQPVCCKKEIQKKPYYELLPRRDCREENDKEEKNFVQCSEICCELKTPKLHWEYQTLGNCTERLNGKLSDIANCRLSKPKPEEINPPPGTTCCLITQYLGSTGTGLEAKYGYLWISKDKCDGRTPFSLDIIKPSVPLDIKWIGKPVENRLCSALLPPV